MLTQTLHTSLTIQPLHTADLATVIGGTGAAFGIIGLTPRPMPAPIDKLDPGIIEVNLEVTPLG